MAAQPRAASRKPGIGFAGKLGGGCGAAAVEPQPPPQPQQEQRSAAAVASAMFADAADGSASKLRAGAPGSGDARQWNTSGGTTAANSSPAKPKEAAQKETRDMAVQAGSYKVSYPSVASPSLTGEEAVRPLSQVSCRCIQMAPATTLKLPGTSQHNNPALAQRSVPPLHLRRWPSLSAECTVARRPKPSASAPPGWPLWRPRHRHRRTPACSMGW